MRLNQWEITIQKIIEECGDPPKDASKIVMGWRERLEKEPSKLEPFEIDQIVREVRRRLENVVG